MRECDREDKNTPQLMIPVNKIKSVNVLIIGNGHYATGMTVLSGVRKTDIGQPPRPEICCTACI